MKAMVLCSGGVDSTTCLGMAVDKYGAENVIALSIYYGQKHTKEIECAKKVTQHYQVEHLSLDLKKIFQYSDCSLLSHSDKEIPQESYASQIEKTNGTPVSTYVRQALHCQRAVKSFTMVHTAMTRREAHTRTVVMRSTGR